MNCDVVIIGGGIIGTSIAYSLSKRKIDVIVVEKGDLASGTSGSCDGFIFMQSKKPGIHLEIALESLKMMQNLVNEFKRDIEYEKNGGMILIESAEDVPQMREYAKKQRSSGLDVEFLGPSEAKAIEPSLSSNIAGAIFSTMDAHVNPVYLCLAYAESAKELGARILLNTEVINIEVSNKKVRGVETTKGKIKADVVVNSAGVYAPQVAKFIGLDVQIIPRRGQIAVTEPIPKLIKSVMICNKYIKSKFNPDQSDQLGLGLSLEQTRSGNLLIGSTREFAGFDRRVSPEGIKAILNNATRFVPEISELNIIRAFAGLRPYTVSGLPIIEKSKDIDGFIVSAGHEGDGIALSPITGEIVADLVTKGKSDLWDRI